MEIFSTLLLVFILLVSILFLFSCQKPKSSRASKDQEVKQQSENLSPLEKEFMRASDIIRKITLSSTADQLKIYGLFKYAHSGPAPPDQKPSILDMQQTAKFNSWNDLGTSLTKEDAMKQYIGLVKKFCPDYDTLDPDQMTAQPADKKEETGFGPVFSRIQMPDTSNEDEEDKDRSTSLWGYVEASNIEEVERLLKEGKTNINEQDNTGRTALIYAVDAGEVAICKLLLAYMPDLDLQDEDGNTALHFVDDNQELAALLLQAGASPSIKNNENNTPFEETNDSQVKAIFEPFLSSTKTAENQKETEIFQSTESDSVPKVQSKPHQNNNNNNNNHNTRQSSSEPKWKIGAWSEKGPIRRTNEDTHVGHTHIPDFPSNAALFGVFDGHSGSAASTFCSKNIAPILANKVLNAPLDHALKQTFVQLDINFFHSTPNSDGCTACIGVLTDDYQLTVANAGDSRCIATKNGQLIEMSQDHKPNDPVEKRRIEESGHTVRKHAVYRVDGILAVARAIGDFQFKDNELGGPEKQAVSCVPDLKSEKLAPGDFIVCACDGLWDVMENEEVINFVAARLKEQLDLNEIARSLTNYAIDDLNSDDNVSVVIVLLQ